MAGLGRRTHYRKHLTAAVLNELPEPSPDEKIARIIAARGGNQFEVCVAGDSSVHLAILPTKFHKLVWVKRGDFVLVKIGSIEKEASGDRGIRHMISHILYKEQVKHLKSKSLWPDEPEFLESGVVTKTNGIQDEVHDDGIVFQGMDADLFVNTNRVSRLEIDDSSDSTEDE